MIFKLDAESQALASAYLAALKSGPGYLFGLVRDAFSVGLLSADVDAELRHELARDDLVLSGADVELTLIPRAPNDHEPRAVRIADALARDVGLPLGVVYLAAVRVGLRRLVPPHLVPEKAS